MTVSYSSPLTAEHCLPNDNSTYQWRLAQTLRAELGLADAVQWCQEHGWEGVLNALLPKPEPSER